MMQVGHNLVYSRNRRLPSVARPITLDQVAIDFPELKLIGIHIGIPWTEEMISMCWKHENVYTAGDAYAPKYWPKEYVHYANSYGKHKVMFGTDWPVIDPERAVREIDELGFRDDAKQMLMRDNALRVFMPADDATHASSDRTAVFLPAPVLARRGAAAAMQRNPAKLALQAQG